jgi:hypothetical protein
MFFKKKKSKFEKIKKWLQVHVLGLFKKKEPKFLLRPKTRNLVFGALLILVLFVSSFYLFFRPEQVTAEWWDINWHYRKAITITNSGSVQTDFQVLVTADTSDTTKFQGDCDDLRFTSVNGESLNYWIESGCSTAATKIWVKIYSIPTNTSTVYMYYGNPNASSYQNGDNTFEFFDDFDAADTSKWEYTGSGYSYAEGVLSIYGSDYEPLESIQSFSNDGLIVRSKIKRDATGDFDSGIWFAFAGGNSGILHVFDDIANGDHCGIVYPSWATVVANYTTEMSVGSWETIEMWRSGTTVYSSAFGEELSATIDVNYSNPIALFSDSDAGTRTASYEYILIRKYATTEPTATLQSEERGPGPVGYWSFDEGYGTTAQDRTSNNNDGTITGATWQTEDMCVSGKCLWFDGTAVYAQLNSSITLSYLDSSISFWINVNSIPSGSYGSRSQCLSYDNNYGHRFIGPTTSKSLQSEGDTNGEYWVSTSSNSLPFNQWNHVVITAEDGEVKTYINGVLKGTRTVTSNLTLNKIGSQDHGDYDQFCDADIDEVKVYDYARTADQVKADYNAGKSGLSSDKGSAVAFGNQQSAINNLSDGLVGYWKMDESSGNVIDASGNGNTGTWNGTGSHYPAGKFGNGGGFNGTDDYVDISDSNSLDLTGDVATFSVWTYWDTITGDHKILAKAVSAGSGASAYQIRSDGSSGNLLFQIYNSTWGTATASGILSSETSKWIYLTVILESDNTVKFYKNGILHTTSSIDQNILSSTGAFAIGKRYGGTPNYFNGSIDEVRIYNRALSPREVRHLYEYAPGPVGHWKMDEGTGTSTIYDTSGSGYNGTMYNLEELDWVAGKYGRALEFDGTNEYVDIPNNTVFDNLKSMTVSAWYYSNIDQRNDDALVSKSNNVNGGYDWIFLEYGSHFYVNTTSGLQSVTITEPSLNTWHYATGTIEPSGSNTLVKIYVDGILIKTQEVVGTWTHSSSYIRFADYHTPTAVWDGIIDDVRIYNYARTQKQILEDMNAGRPAQKSPVGYWKFDEGYGTTAHDAGLGENDGTITGADWTNSGKIGKALDFNGSSDYVHCGSINQTESFSFGVWLYPSSIPSYNSDSYLYASSGGTSLRFSLSASTLSNNVRWRLPDASFVTYYLSDSVSVNKWVYINVVYDGINNVLKGYKNGDLQYTYNDIDIYSDFGGTIEIGRNLTNSAYYTGRIDEVKIYNYALTEDEVRAEYNQGKVAVMGAPSSSADGSGDYSSAREYCVPGDDSYCEPPVAEWKFEEHSGIYAYDTSGNGNTGTLTNMEESDWVPGKIGRGLEFDGSDEYVQPVSSGFYPSCGTGCEDPYTISAWIKTDNFAQEAAIAGRFDSIGSDHWHTYGSGLKYVNGSIAVMGRNNGDNDLLTYDISDSKWHHVVGITNTSNGKLYVDGILVDSGVLNSGYTYGFCIGAQCNEGNSFNFDGLIDQVKIYDYARTPAQVAWEYNKGKPIAHWRFDEGQGATLLDSSGNGNHGTLNLGTSGQIEAGSVKINANTPWYNGREGKQNYSLNFDGSDDYVNLDAYKENFNIDTFTISAWVNLDVLKNYSRVFGTFHSGYTGYRFLINSNGTLTFLMTNNSDGSLTGKTSSGSIDISNWHFVAITKNGTTLKFYIDNRNAEEFTLTESTIRDGAECRIGYESNNGAYLDGQIDEVRIYNYALTPLQIKTEYNFGAARLGSGE